MCMFSLKSIKKAVFMNFTLTCVRVDYSAVPTNQRVPLRGSLTRFVSANYGRVMCSSDESFFVCDLDSQKVALLCRILEVSGAVASLRLVSSSFFAKLFSGEVVR